MFVHFLHTARLAVPVVAFATASKVRCESLEKHKLDDEFEISAHTLGKNIRMHSLLHLKDMGFKGANKVNPISVGLIGFDGIHFIFL